MTRRSNFPKLKLEHVPICSLTKNAFNPRRHPPKQINQLASSIREFGFNTVVVHDEKRNILKGNALVAAAEQLGMEDVPAVCVRHLSPEQKRAFAIADNKIPENATWDLELLKSELKLLSNFDCDFNFSAIGFETAEVDLILGDDNNAAKDDALPRAELGLPSITKLGDIWQLGESRLICGNSLSAAVYQSLLGDIRARAVITDPPYNVPVDGHVGGKGRVKHREFVMASGEMSTAEFTEFLANVCSLAARFSLDGSLHYIFMDWKHTVEVLNAARTVYSEQKTTCVWAKTNAGMGSLYRSQHEFVHVFKHGCAPHVNNIQPGAYGRDRSNLWTYPGINSFGHERDELLTLHPTVKPVSLVADIIKDCTHRGDLVLDCFAGSGTTLIAAQKSGRRAALIEIDPLYCDIIVRRWQTFTGNRAVCSSGTTFADRERMRNALSHSPIRLLAPPDKSDADD